MNNRKAIFPGSFDPIHEGHISIIKKALDLFDFVYIAITNNPDKIKNNTYEEKFAIVKEKLKDFKNIEIIINEDKLTADLAKELDVNYLIRSARNDLDFAYELELANGNKIVNPYLETILIFPNIENITYSSTLERHKKKLKEQE